MVVESVAFGQIEVSDEKILRFDDGLPGFPDEKTFAFLPYGPDSPFAFLQSTTSPFLIFLVVDPFTIFKDYQVDLSDDLAREMELSEGSPPFVFNIVTIKDKLEDMTANLLAPVVVNWNNREGMQVVLEKSPYTTSHRLFPKGFPAQAGGGGK
ncbi:MAG: flagellar assembly protein FliW [Negativicutes bacterium]|nr:flagellar assembly protein FliW [Negativicutes bacterium]